MLDLAIVALLGTAVFGGYKLGLVVGTTSWVLLVQGLVVATLALPAVEGVFGSEPSPPRLFVACLLFVGLGYAAQWAGREMGSRFRDALLSGQARHQDRVAGAVAGPVTVLVAIWLLLLAPMAGGRTWPASLVQESAIASTLDRILPAAPDTAHALGKLSGPAGLPEVYVALGPPGDGSPPPGDTGFGAELVARVMASTVKVEGEACGIEREGSGFTIEDGLVVTNAHVVAGQHETMVVRPDGARLAAEVAVFDPHRDVALLRVEGLGQQPLPLAEAPNGSIGAVFGHPGGRDETVVSPARVRWRLEAEGVDLYGQDVRRDIYVLAAELEPGDSGGALVDANGAVTGVAFAVAHHSDTLAYALSTGELRPILEAERHRSPVATGPCIP